MDEVVAVKSLKGTYIYYNNKKIFVFIVPTVLIHH